MIPTAVPAKEVRPPVDVAAARDEMNRIQAKLIKAKIMDMDVDPKLEERFEELRKDIERAAEEARSARNRKARGRLQDIGEEGPSRLLPGNRLTIPFEQDTGDADENTDINQLLLREKMSTGDSYDRQFANQIAKDITYKEGLDYMDDRADDFAKKPKASVTFQRNMAVSASQDSCVEKWDQTYLALPNFIDMVPYHCLIVPIQHTITTLELEDDVWDEIRNFMKCLIQMHWELGNGVIFIEQVINLKWHRHTFIECIPVPQDKFEDAPAYFKEAINASEEEWSQHRKLIDTSKNGFRRSLTKELPYFHVWFDPNRGYGHVIEEGQSWEEWFGRQVIASMMDLPPDKWRRPKRANLMDNERRAQVFMKAFSKHDWTKMLEG
ncbi:CwfJ C-terminus 2-domain-containing protein-like protein [Chytridium lagenaria]|nr:CwfJ C-terminus 2-domain-containing protein-like protein [Chytridium lagenaria]